MKISKEFGGWITSILTFILSIHYSIAGGFIFQTIIFWIPVFLGLMMFDTHLNEFKIQEIILTLIALFAALYSIYIYIYLFIPYTLFLFSYYLKTIKFKNYMVTLTGIFGESLMLLFSSSFSGKIVILIPFLIFIYLYGAEFGVRSFLKKNVYYSFYNFLPAAISIPLGFPIFSISILRLIYFKIKKIKIIGIFETILYTIIVLFLIL
ncbi:MAG: hypothetical protein QXE07_00995 [Thermoplasmata archaeon]